MMCWIMGVQAPLTLARACELGVAMQLTNIARDVGEDARNGRVYLPLTWLAQAGVDTSEWLRQPRPVQGVKDVTGRLLAASLIYADIGHQLRREGLDSVSNRTVVSTRRKMVLLASAWTQAGWIYSNPKPPAPLPAIAFLIDPTVLTVQEGAPKVSFPNRAVPQRIEWVLGLLERLENERRGRKPLGQSS